MKLPQFTNKKNQAIYQKCLNIQGLNLWWSSLLHPLWGWILENTRRICIQPCLKWSKMQFSVPALGIRTTKRKAWEYPRIRPPIKETMRIEMRIEAALFFSLP